MLSKNFFGLRGKKLNAMVVATAGMAFLLFGYDQGVMGSLLTLPTFTKQFPQLDTVHTKGAKRNHNATLQGTAVAIYEIGGMFGALASLFLGDRLGRLKMIFCGHAIIILGAVLQSSAYGLPQFIVARIVTGLGTGVNTVTIPIWQAESSKSSDRGMYLMIEGAMITGGVALSYWLDYGFKFVTNSTVSWRFPIAFQAVFAIFVCFVILDMPESPRWLMKQNRPGEARRTMEALYADEDRHLIEADLNEIHVVLAVSEENSWRSMFSNNNPTKNLHRLCLGLAHSVFHQICGINLIVYYAATIYQQYLGLNANQSRIITASVNGTGYFLASFIAVFLIERVGRRKLMLVGSFGQMMGMAVLAGVTAFPGKKGPGAAGAVFLYVVQFFFAIGWLAMVWLYPAEVVPLRIRAKASGLMVATTWVFNFLIVEITPVSLSSIGYRTYIIFLVLNAFIFVCVYLYFPETAYRSLEEIDAIFATSHGIRDVVRVSKTLPHLHGKHGEILTNVEDTKAMFEHELMESKEADTSAVYREEVVPKGQ